MSLEFGATLPDRGTTPADEGATAPATPPSATLPSATLPPAFDGASVLVRELARTASSRGRGRAAVVARTRGEGKELLRQVALRGQSWAGLEITTVLPLATEVAMSRILRENVKVADRFEEQAVAEEAIDDVISHGKGRLERFVNKVGFREAVRTSISELREGGVPVGNLTSRVIEDREKHALVAKGLARYEALLRERKLVDSAGVVTMALAALANETGNEQGEQGEQGEQSEQSEKALAAYQAVYLLPGLSNRGLAGRFVCALQHRGAVLLKTDPVPDDLPPPDHLLWAAEPRTGEGGNKTVEGGIRTGEGGTKRIDFFAAASVYDELRGVLRRALDRRARWDQVEIVTPDAKTYGSALHALTEPMKIDVNFAVGLPVERTRPGRVASAYFRWIESDFQEPVFRALLEAGDIKPPDRLGRIGGPRLARALRRLRIGWGRERYLKAVDNVLANLPQASKRHYEDDEQFERRKKTDDQNMRALRAVLAPVLKATPATGDPKVSPAQVATGAKSLLNQVADGTPTDDTARDRLAHILDRIEATQTRKTDFASACNIVQGFLRVSVPAPKDDGPSPWSAVPGRLYLSDLHHGGATGRPFTFVVGMDSARFPGAALEDPLLLDGERQRLGKGVLRLAGDRPAEARFLFEALFARLRGNVTFSYCRWDPAEARPLTPSPEMLKALRRREGNPSLTFDDLDRTLGLAESRLPDSRVPTDVDASDVWLRALAADGERLRDGRTAVGHHYPGLARGLAVDRALESDRPSVHTGILGAAPSAAAAPSSSADDAAKPSYCAAFDKPYSASALQTLGACPRRFLFMHVIRAKPPDDPEYDPERWLDAMTRGGLLHKVYQRALHQARKRNISYDDDAFLELVLALIEERARQARIDVPSPSDAVLAWEMDALRDDARAFVEIVRREPPPWIEVEWRFGYDDEVKLDTPAGSVQLRGAIDRVDKQPNGLRVIDYKTGKANSYNDGLYNGGRRLQHVVYCEAASQKFDAPIQRMEYHYPTRRGENAVKVYDWQKLQDGRELIAMLLEGVSKGWFPPTNSAKDDCRICDYKDVCDVREGKWGVISSRYADWSQQNLDELQELSVLRRARQKGKTR